AGLGAQARPALRLASAQGARRGGGDRDPWPRLRAVPRAPRCGRRAVRAAARARRGARGAAAVARLAPRPRRGRAGRGDGEPPAGREIRGLEERHTAALEVAIDQALDAGRPREVLREIDGLLAAEPLREALHARRMLALYRCGRQADALAAYGEARRTLIEQ